MNGGRYLLLIGCSLAAVGCSASHELKVRPVGQSAVKPGPGNTLLAQARGQLALGNVGLALEAYQTLHRQEPESPDAYEGIAECYEAMGRYDVARTNYEFALAYAPNSPSLLRRLAGTLDRLGEHQQARDAWAEASSLQTNQLSASTQQAAITPMSVPRAGSVTVKLVDAAPAAQPRRPSPPAPVAPLPKPVATPVAEATSVAPAPARITRDLAPVVSPVGQATSVPPAPPPARRTDARATIAALPATKEVVSVAIPRPAAVLPASATYAVPIVAVPAIAVTAAAPRAVPIVAAAQRPEEVVAVAIQRPAPVVHAPATPPVPMLAIASIAISAPAVAAAPRPAPVSPPVAPRTAMVAVRAQDTQPARPQPARPHVALIAPPAPEVAIAHEPHLERTTRGEVLLVTVAQPVRALRIADPIKLAQAGPPVQAPRATIPMRPAADGAPVKPPQPAYRPVEVAATQVRWVRLKGAPTGNIQLLNAARFEGLAARTRSVLADRGWHRIAIGNARQVRQHSLVLYGSARAHLAKRLAAQFRCRAVKVGSMRSVIVLLGRDAMKRSAPTARA